MTADHPTREEQYAAGTLLRDADGRYWLVRDDGWTAAGTNGGVMVDLRRGEPVYTPALVAADPAPAQPENWNPNTAGPECDWCGECDWCLNLHRPAQPHAALSDDDLAEVLSWASGEFTRYSETAHADHNRWSWRGDGHGEAARQVFIDQAAAIREHLAARAVQPDPAPEVSRGVAEVKAEALREAADEIHPRRFAKEDGSLLGPDNFYNGVRTAERLLRDRADRLVRDALGGERGDGA